MRGLIIGKMMPPTVGHGSLIQHGIEFMRQIPETKSDLDVVVCSRPSESIPGDARHLALHETFGTEANVFHFQNTLADEPSSESDDLFWQRWSRGLSNVTGLAEYDFVFASEKYGTKLASLFGAKFIPVDIGRRSIPIAATIVRNDIMANWDYILPAFRHNFVTRVAVVGPESCGKTTLCRNLAQYFKTEWVPEWARGYLEADGDRYPVPEDYPLIAQAHAASEDALARFANQVLISDTDAVCTAVAARRLNSISYDHVVERYCTERKYDLRIIMADDVPFVADPLRYGVSERQFNTAEFVEEYRSRQIKDVMVIDGDWEKRFTKAVVAISNVMNCYRVKY